MLVYYMDILIAVVFNTNVQVFNDLANIEVLLLEMVEVVLLSGAVKV